MKTFEQPLSAKEEKEYLKLYQNGDREAGDILILRNMRLVAHMVKHYSYGERDMGELISIGTIGLIKAVQTFDSSKGSRLATYAARCIDNELLMALRSERKRYKDVSLQEPIGTDKEGNEINIMDIVVSDNKDFLDNYILQNDIKTLYDAVENTLCGREKEIIIRRYGLYGHQEATQREIAAHMKISRSYVSRIEKRALEKLKRYFAG